MTIQINLPADSENKLESRAARRGLSLEQYVEMLIQWEADFDEASSLSNEEVVRLRAALDEGLKSEAEGRMRPLDAFVQEQRTKYGLTSK